MSSYLPLKFVNFPNFWHILRAHIWENKRYFNMKSSANYFQMTTKILADFQICISERVRFFRVLTHVFFNMRHFGLQIFQPCYGTQRNHILDETGTDYSLKNFPLKHCVLSLQIYQKIQLNSQRVWLYLDYRSGMFLKHNYFW